jgi:hypothetical protein
MKLDLPTDKQISSESGYKSKEDMQTPAESKQHKEQYIKQM